MGVETGVGRVELNQNVSFGVQRQLKTAYVLRLEPFFLFLPVFCPFSPFSAAAETLTDSFLGVNTLLL